MDLSTSTLGSGGAIASVDVSGMVAPTLGNRGKPGGGDTAWICYVVMWSKNMVASFWRAALLLP